MKSWRRSAHPKDAARLRLVLIATDVETEFAVGLRKQTAKEFLIATISAHVHIRKYKKLRRGIGLIATPRHSKNL